MPAREALVAYERARYSSQLSFVEGWLGPLREARVAPDAAGFQRAWEARNADPQALFGQLRADLERDAVRLASAARGGGRSAVPAGWTDAVPSPAAFAAHEAHHIATAVRRFVEQASLAGTPAQFKNAIERGQRWSQRLRWELLDTHCRDPGWDANLASASLQRWAQTPKLDALHALARTYLGSLDTLLHALQSTPT